MFRKFVSWSIFLHLVFIFGEQIYYAFLPQASLTLENTMALRKQEHRERKLIKLELELEEDEFGVSWKVKPKEKEIIKESKVESSKVEWDEDPALLRNTPPVYPEAARKAGLEGLTLLWVKIDNHGNPIEVNIKKSSGYSVLDEAAKRSVKGWSFHPARIAGTTIESSVLIPIRFRLNEVDFQT